jgi:hypothetical protein
LLKQLSDFKPKTTLPEKLFNLICELIKSNKVQSVSCPFDDYALWRKLIKEQVHHSNKTGLPPQIAFYLSGPDSGLPDIIFEEWGGEVHIPYEGCTGGDLFIYPTWRRFRPEKVGSDGKLSDATGGKPCHFILIEGDYGEIKNTRKTSVASWVLYESLIPYTPCSPLTIDLDPDFGDLQICG